MYKKESGFGHKIHRPHKGSRLRLVVLIYLSVLIEHISLNKINNHGKEIRDSFPKYFENRKQTNLKLLHFPILDGFLPKTSDNEYSWICKWDNFHILFINSKAMFKRFFGTIFIKLCWPQAEILLIYHVFADFSQTMYYLILMNIHEYANELICIFEYQIKGQCQSFKLVPTLSLYVKHRLSYD